MALTWHRRLFLFVLGCTLGAGLFVLGGLVDQPMPARCPRCVVMNQPYSCPSPQAVVGGWICD